MCNSQNNYTSIIGKWVIKNGQITRDVNCHLIEEMIKSQLEVIDHLDDGWRIILRDKANGNIWELTYPESHLHGGGPPSLVRIK